MKIGDSLNINLLPSQAKFQADKIKLKKTIRYYETLGLILWGIVIMVVAILYFGSGFILNSQQKKYQQSVNNFQSMSEEIVINQLLKYRAKVLGQVLKDRFEYSAAFEKVSSLFLEKAKVETFELDDIKKEFKITLTAKDKEGVDYIEDKMVEVNEGRVEGVKNMTITGVSYTVGDDWSINMEIMI